MGYQQQLAVRPGDFGAATRRKLQKGVLGSSFLRGPGRCYKTAGHQPAGSGQHYIAGVPILSQFPLEILLKILGHLDAIWLFQAEAACSQVRTLLRSSISNRTWYNAIPAALLAQPEYFQSEREVALVQLRDQSQPYSIIAIDASQVSYLDIKSLVRVGENVIRFPPKSDSNSIYFTLPALGEVSGLWEDMDLSWEAHHPHQKFRNQYPFVKSAHPNDGKRTLTRKRTLALGGPFDTSMSYRRELLGHMQHNGRCYVCYESFSEFRSRNQRFGMQFCETCLASLTVEPADAQKIPGLLRLFEQGGSGVWEPSRFLIAAIEGFWLPEVDEILRNFTGIDYHTTVAKQRYLHYLYAATAPEVEKGLRATKRMARGMIVVEAKKLWDAPKGFARAVTDDIDRFRRSFAPTSKLSQFLYPDQLLHVEAISLPHDTEAMYIRDHTEHLQSIGGVRAFMQSPDRIVNAARLMVSDLIQAKNRVTTLVQAAHEWHVNRLSASLTFERLMSSGYVPGGAGHRGTRFQVILEKLHLLPAEITWGLLLTKDGLENAMKVLPRIIESSCIACPRSNLLASRGIDGIVSHVRECHPDMFWSGKFEING